MAWTCPTDWTLSEACMAHRTVLATIAGSEPHQRLQVALDAGRRRPAGDRPARSALRRGDRLVRPADPGARPPPVPAIAGGPGPERRPPWRRSRTSPPPPSPSPAPRRPSPRGRPWAIRAERWPAEIRCALLPPGEGAPKGRMRGSDSRSASRPRTWLWSEPGPLIRPSGHLLPGRREAHRFGWQRDAQPAFCPCEVRLPVIASSRFLSSFSRWSTPSCSCRQMSSSRTRKATSRGPQSSRASV